MEQTFRKSVFDSSSDSTEKNNKYIEEVKDSQDLESLMDTGPIKLFKAADSSVEDEESFTGSSSSSTSSSCVTSPFFDTFHLSSSGPHPEASQYYFSSPYYLPLPTVQVQGHTLNTSQIQPRTLNPGGAGKHASSHRRCALQVPSGSHEEWQQIGTPASVLEKGNRKSAFSTRMSSSRSSGPVCHEGSNPISSTSSSSSSSSTSEKIKTGSAECDTHQTTSQIFEPLVMLKTYKDMSLLLTKESNMAARRPETCWSPARERYPTGSLSEVNMSGIAASLPNRKFQSRFQEFTPDFTDDDDNDDKGDEVYRFRCPGPGLYQCRETGLVFDMKAGGDLTYRMLPWNRRSLSQHHKKPAGPLFDITCPQQSVGQLHLPHCEVRSTGAGVHLSVAHVNHEGMEFIRPVRITETHVVINITGLSAFGNVKDEDSPPVPVQALVLLFYKSPAEPEANYEINVLLLPSNVPVRKVLRFRRRLDKDEMFLETPPYCKLQPGQVYTLSTGSEQDSVLVQPKEAEFDSESYDNYLPTFQVVYEKLMKRMKLFLKDSSSTSVWDRRVYLTCGTNRFRGLTRQNLPSDEQLLEIRSSFVDRVSGPVLQSLLDKLLKSKVLSDAEREEAEKEKNRGDKARFIIDTVRKKGRAAESEMIQFLCELDPFLSKHLGLM